MKKSYVIWPLVILLVGVISEYSGLDVFLAGRFYDATNNTWPYKSWWLTSTVLHKGGRDLVVTIGVVVFLVLIISFFVKKLSRYRKGVAYLLVASLAGPLLVSIGKNCTHIYTPWALGMFGGTHPYIRLFDPVPAGAAVGHAFPAGHSSGGFALFSLFFLALEYRPSIKYIGLAVPLVLGFTFGIAQQARGAHFLSHDLFSLAICWYAALVTYFFFFKKDSVSDLRSN